MLENIVYDGSMEIQKIHHYLVENEICFYCELKLFLLQNLSLHDKDNKLFFGLILNFWETGRSYITNKQIKPYILPLHACLIAYNSLELFNCCIFYFSFLVEIWSHKYGQKCIFLLFKLYFLSV
jgi:hypothetical protein